MLESTSRVYGRDARNRLQETSDESSDGARAALETFYCAFNCRDLELLAAIWLDHPLSQLNNPLGGILQGREAIVELYDRVFHGPGRAWVQLEDITEVVTPNAVVFAGRERGEFATATETVPLLIRTSRIMVYEPDVGWRQTHHHGSIDDPALLARYQAAVAGGGEGVAEAR
jgi:hypothetical protein